MKRVIIVLISLMILIAVTSCRKDDAGGDEYRAATNPAASSAEQSEAEFSSVPLPRSDSATGTEETHPAEETAKPAEKQRSTPAPTQVSTPAAEKTETPKPQKTPEPTQTPAPKKLLSGYIIGIDPGHQRHGNHDKEPQAPGSDMMKAKVSSGTEGIYTHVPEYQVNLDVGLLLRDMLEDAGATVVMTRTTNDVDITNIERAQLFNRKKTDYAIRLHCNGSDNHDKHGAFMLIPTKNPYLSECKRAAQLLIDAYCEATGAKNLGLTYRSDQTGFNWCERMIINIEMGHLSNRDEDILLTSRDYQEKMAEGLFDGIVRYFADDGDIGN